MARSSTLLAYDDDESRPSDPSRSLKLALNDGLYLSNEFLASESSVITGRLSKNPTNITALYGAYGLCVSRLHENNAYVANHGA